VVLGSAIPDETLLSDGLVLVSFRPEASQAGVMETTEVIGVTEVKGLMEVLGVPGVTEVKGVIEVLGVPEVTEVMVVKDVMGPWGCPADPGTLAMP